MPIYKGSTEVTSGNLHKGSTEVQDGYKGADSFYVNQTTLTIQFVNNTGLAISSGQLVNTITGIPGQTINQVSLGVSASASQRLNSLSFSESGDTGSNLTGSTSGVNVNAGTMLVNGTFPTTPTTVVYTLTASVNNLIQLTGSSSVTTANISCCGFFSVNTYMYGPAVNGSIQLRGFADSTAAQAALPYVSASVPIQPVSGGYTVTQSPNLQIQADPSGGWHVLVNAPGSYVFYALAGGVTFGSAGQTASLSASISKASGYYVTGTTSGAYMQYV